MQTFPAFQTELEPIREGQNGSILILFKDADDVPVAAEDVVSLTLDLYDLRRYQAYLAAVAAWEAAGSIEEDEPEDDSTINGRAEEDILNANGGEYFDTLQSATINGEAFPYNFRFDYHPADTPFLGEDAATQQVESHIARVYLRWDGGAGAIGHEILMKVTNLRRFQVEADT